MISIYVPDERLEEVRRKLAELAERFGKSGSEYLVTTIDRLHQDLVGGGGLAAEARYQAPLTPAEQEGLVRDLIRRFTGDLGEVKEELGRYEELDPSELLAGLREEGKVSVDRDGRLAAWVPERVRRKRRAEEAQTYARMIRRYHGEYELPGFRAWVGRLDLDPEVAAAVASSLAGELSEAELDALRP